MDEYWQAPIAYHVDTYPASRSTPGDVCLLEAERLTARDLGDTKKSELIETRAEHVGRELALAHVLLDRPLGIRLLTEPYRGYA